MWQADRFIRECEEFVESLNDPALDAPEVIASARAHFSAVIWCNVAGLCDPDAVTIFEQVLYNNLWTHPASLAERRVAGQLDDLFCSVRISDAGRKS